MSVANSKKVLSTVDVILMTIASNFGIRWIAVAASIGPSSLFLWLFGAVVFFLPLSIMVARMSRIYPEEGGIYAWANRTLGEKSGFTVAWLYLVNNIFYYPAALIFLASNLAYFLGRPELANDTTYITTTTLIAFWLIILISLLGLKTSKYLVNLGSVAGAFIPVALLIIFGTLAYFSVEGSATQLSIRHWLPGEHITSHLPALAMIMFAMAGVEVIATFANRVEKPQRELYFGLLLGAGAIFLLYVIGTVSMNILATPEELQQTTGVMQAFAIVGQRFNVAWLTSTMAGLLTFAELAAVIVWVLAPVIMFFKCTPRGILPEWMHTANKEGTPRNALLLQGGIVSLVIVITSALPSVNSMYQVLVLMATILYFIPYLFLVVAFIKSLDALKIRKSMGYLLATGVVVSIILGIAVSFIPSEDLKATSDIIRYEAELILGPVLFIFAGWALYKLRRR